VFPRIVAIDDKTWTTLKRLWTKRAPLANERFQWAKIRQMVQVNKIAVKGSQTRTKSTEN